MNLLYSDHTRKFGRKTDFMLQVARSNQGYAGYKNHSQITEAWVVCPAKSFYFCCLRWHFLGPCTLYEEQKWWSMFCFLQWFTTCLKNPMEQLAWLQRRQQARILALKKGSEVLYITQKYPQPSLLECKTRQVSLSLCNLKSTCSGSMPFFSFRRVLLSPHPTPLFSTQHFNHQQWRI